MLKSWTVPKVLPYLLLIGGIIGYACAFVIMFDKVQILKNSHYVPSCSLNPVISCGSVMQSKQANVFGFPNPFIGLGAYPAIAVVGAALLAGAKFKKWFWLMFGAGLTLGLAFAYWLLAESVYRIHALCPYCLAIDVVTIVMFWYTSLYIVDNKFIKLSGAPARAYAWVRHHHLDILVLWFLILIGLILKHFWYYYSKRLF